MRKKPGFEWRFIRTIRLHLSAAALGKSWAPSKVGSVFVDIVPSKCNGITFDCGVTREMGHDPVETCRYFGKKDCINHVHYRNVRVTKPYENYSEVFIDEGFNDMFAVMRELVRQKYPRLIYPEHPRGLDADKEREGFKSGYPGGGGYAAFAYNVGFAKAMLLASLSK